MDTIKARGDTFHVQEILEEEWGRIYSVTPPRDQPFKVTVEFDRIAYLTNAEGFFPGSPRGGDETLPGIVCPYEGALRVICLMLSETDLRDSVILRINDGGAIRVLDPETKERLRRLEGRAW